MRKLIFILYKYKSEKKIKKKYVINHEFLLHLTICFILQQLNYFFIKLKHTVYSTQF